MITVEPTALVLPLVLASDTGNEDGSVTVVPNDDVDVVVMEGHDPELLDVKL